MNTMHGSCFRFCTHCVLFAIYLRPDRALIGAKLARMLEESLLLAGRSVVEVSVLLTGDREIRKLNKQYRKINRPTDVLSFSMQEGVHISGQENLLGDVVVSVETARRQAQEQGHALHRELAILLQHGLIHLLGVDHEALRYGGRFRQWEELLRPALDTAFPARR